jgi:hypothetical protein
VYYKELGLRCKDFIKMKYRTKTQTISIRNNLGYVFCRRNDYSKPIPGINASNNINKP